MSRNLKCIFTSFLLYLVLFENLSIYGQSNETTLHFENIVVDSLVVNGFSVHSADINSDGLKDIAFSQTDSAIGIYYQSSGGAYTGKFFVPDTGGIFNIMIADFYNSSLKQIAYSSIYSGFSILTILDDSTSFFENISPSIRWNFDIGDLNQDGLLDVVGNNDGRSTELVVLYQTSQGIFEENILDIESGFGYGIRAIDYDRDDDLDIIASVVNGYDKLLFYENIGNENFLKHILLSNTPGILDFDVALVDSLSYLDIYYVSNPFESTSTINRFRYGSATNESQILANGFSQLWTISATNIDLDSEIEIISGERNLASLFYLDFVDDDYEHKQISDEIAYITDLKIVHAENCESTSILYVAGNMSGPSDDVDTCAVGTIILDEVYSDSTFLYYTFNNLEGDIIYDESQHGNNGILNNIDQVETFGQFSDSSYITINSDYYRLLDDELLIEILFSPSSIQQRASLISCFADGGYEVFLENGTIHSKLVIDCDTLLINSTINIVENTWNHFAINLAENQIKMYLNYQQIEDIQVDGRIRYGDMGMLILGQSIAQASDTNSQYYGLMGGLKISAISYDIEYFINYDPSSIFVPNNLETFAAYPNPFNPSTTIRYNLSNRTMISLVVYDVLGREITNIENGIKSEGNYEVQWNGFDRSGYKVGTGVYFCRLQAGDYSQTIKMLYLK